MQSQVYILIAVAAVMFLVIGGLSLLAHYYTLNGIKSRTVGDGQHGTARFASKQEIKNTYQHIPFQQSICNGNGADGIVSEGTFFAEKFKVVVVCRVELKSAAYYVSNNCT